MIYILFPILPCKNIFDPSEKNSDVSLSEIFSICRCGNSEKNITFFFKKSHNCFFSTGSLTQLYFMHISNTFLFFECYWAIYLYYGLSISHFGHLSIWLYLLWLLSFLISLCLSPAKAFCIRFPVPIAILLFSVLVN